MPGLKAGLEEVVKTLQLMNSHERKKLLAELTLKDPQMAALIEMKLVSLCDLKELSVQMLAELLKKINFKDLALALRDHPKELQSFIKSKISRSMGLTLDETLAGPKQRASDVQEAEQRVMKVFRLMLDQGDLILKKDDEYI